MSMLGHHERSTISTPTIQAFTTTHAVVQLVSDPSGDTPAVFQLYGSQDCMILQGDSTVEVVGTTGWTLAKRTYWVLTVERTEQSYISVITPSGGSNGNLTILRTNKEFPA